MTPSLRPQATSVADTVWSVVAAVVSVVLLVAGVVVLSLAERDVRSARAQLTSDVLREARAENRSPRDPAVLAVVGHRLPTDIELVPSPDVLTSGRIQVISRELHTRSRRLCLILPTTPGGRIASCPQPARSSQAGATGPTVVGV